jgi:Flp pilus assembly pilin Flp
MSQLQQLRLLLGRGEPGQAMVEYAIVTALIAVVALVAVQSLGTSIVGVFRSIVSAITGI